MPQMHFAKRWFFATGYANTPTKMQSGAIVPFLVNYLHELLAEDVYEYQWAQINDKSAIDGWFQPKSVHADEKISAIVGVTLLPSLHDSTPDDGTLAKLLAHANVQKGDNGFAIIKKLCDHHHKTPEGYKHVGLRPELY